MNTTDYSNIILEIEEAVCTRFAQLFSKGVGVRARTGCSIEEFVCGQLGVSQEYLEERIQTIFLDGKPVDDHLTARFGDGSMLALSAAMPGLVGAIMRRGGYYSAMRQSITHTADSGEVCALDGLVTVKLFNLTARELGPVLLKNGILVEADDQLDVFTRFADSFRKGCTVVRFDCDPIDSNALVELLEKKDRIVLQVEII